MKDNLIDGLNYGSKRFLIKYNNKYVNLFRVRKTKYEGYEKYGELSTLYLLDEVLNRELVSVNKILNKYTNKKILIVGHSTATMALFSKWCECQYDGPYKFNGKEFFDGKWDYCETFKLIFDDQNNLIDIINIKQITGG